MALITVADIRAEGVTTSEADDPRVQAAIDEVEIEIEELTGNFFEPRVLTYKLEGRGHKVLKVPAPIISITSVKILNPDGTVFDTLVAADYFIYNRHLTQRLRNPDDRRYPRIELTPSGYSRPGLINDVFANGRFNYFPAHPMAVEVVGKFGWTDWSSGNADGVTPARIKRAAKLMVLPKLPKMTDYSAREDAQRWRISSESTREQGYTRKVGGSLGEIGPITGDPEIDALLVDYLSSPGMGAP